MSQTGSQTRVGRGWLALRIGLGLLILATGVGKVAWLLYRRVSHPPSRGERQS